MNRKVNLLTLLFGILFASVLLGACSNDPTKNDLFVGTYKGTITYINGLGEVKGNDNGTITVTKVGSGYSFFFSDDIPALTGVKFEKKGDNTYVSLGDGFTGIIITETTLNMAVVKDGQTWTVNAKRK